MANVTLGQVKKVYDNGFEAVHGASFEVADGEFVVLVGPSGCGKSTTLRMIAGLESISGGELQIGDLLVNDVPPKDRDIAMVFQNYALYPHMTVFDNMAFGLKLRKFPKTEIKDRVTWAAETLGIAEILDRKPKQLSGGQRQRVAVGRAIVRKPQVFLFDEPLSNLDAKLRVQMRTEISKLHRQLKATMIYVTHDQVEAMTMGDRIVVMKDGHIQQIDAPLTLYNAPTNKFVASFIGSPAMNFIEGKLLEEDGVIFKSDDEALSISLRKASIEGISGYVNQSIILGIRPENIYLGARIGQDVAPAEVGTVTLDEVEPMGNEMFLYTSTSAHSLVARVVPQALPAIGEALPLVFDVNKLHFFDPDTEVVIMDQEPATA